MRIEATQKLKDKLLKQNHGFCAVCGIFRSSEVHHIVPLWDGGTSVEGNLVALCGFCHDCVPGKEPDGYVDEFDIYKQTGGMLWNFFRLGYIAAGGLKPAPPKEYAKQYRRMLKMRKKISSLMQPMNGPEEIHIMSA